MKRILDFKQWQCHLLVASAMEKEDAGSADPVGEGECAISAIIGEFIL